MLDPITLAVPLFFVLIAIELLWAKRRRVSVYRFTDAVTDLSCGVTSQVVLIFWAATQLAVYAAVYRHTAWLNLSPAWGRPWLPWAVAFLGVDFLYYWWHRMSHEVNVLWAAHVVHHQSEDYNLAVALRQSVLTSWTGLPFYLPLALVGVPTVVFATVLALSTLYQFWIHTQLVGKIRGPIDWFFNLPSHHRVHHAVNPQYLDKNYGATLVVWDRLFGTYAEEIEPPVYGITTPLASFNPIWAQFHYWVEMRELVRASSGLLEKLRVGFASPAWKPRAYLVAKVEPGALAARAKYDRPISRRLARYVTVQYAIVVVATFCLLTWQHTVPSSVLAVSAAAIVGALFATGALLEARRWAVQVEIARLALGGLALAMWISFKTTESLFFAHRG